MDLSICTLFAETVVDQQIGHLKLFYTRICIRYSLQGGEDPFK